MWCFAEMRTAFECVEFGEDNGEKQEREGAFAHSVLVMFIPFFSATLGRDGLGTSRLASATESETFRLLIHDLTGFDPSNMCGRIALTHFVLLGELIHLEWIWPYSLPVSSCPPMAGLHHRDASALES